MLTRRNWLGTVARGAGLAALAACTAEADAAPGPKAVVYKSPTCGCCQKWVDHLSDNGFDVSVKDMPDVAPIKQRYGVPAALASCHTALIGGYAIEGHVPADLVHRLLREKPRAIGLAVPGMPMGSPGMEGFRKDDYDVLLIEPNGASRVYARR